jgi:hypothetical protein
MLNTVQEYSLKKNSYKTESVLDNNKNKVYYLVNNVSKTPFKVNIDVLNFLNREKGANLLYSKSD